MKASKAYLFLVCSAILIFGAGCNSRLKSASSDNITDLLLNPEKEGSANFALVPASSTSSGSSPLRFTFNAYGDAGWAKTHVSKPSYTGGFKAAFERFDSSRELIGDINYINWETTVGTKCDQFWAPSTASTFAFLSHPQDLSDAINIGFNLVGLANNHTYDCLSSPEGVGPLQTHRHVQEISSQITSQPNNETVLFSGVFQLPNEEPRIAEMSIGAGESIPITFISAYVGGDLQHCKHMLCDHALVQYARKMGEQQGLRVLALHSWNVSSHERLKSILRSWLKQGLIDIAIGSGPHIAEPISIVQTPRGPRVMATSLGNFIHPSLASQPNNVILRTQWIYDPSTQHLQLDGVKGTVASCVGEECRKGTTRVYAVPQAR